MQERCLASPQLFAVVFAVVLAVVFEYMKKKEKKIIAKYRLTLCQQNRSAYLAASGSIEQI